METALEPPKPRPATPAQAIRPITSPTVRNLQISGWVLFICLWLPVAKGCNGVDTYPIDGIFDGNLFTSLEGCLSRLSVLYAWGHTLFLAVAVAASAILASPAFFRRTFLMQALTFGVLLASNVYLSFKPMTSLYEYTRGFVFWILPLVILVWWTIRPLLSGAFWRGWARFHFLSALYSFAFLNFACLFGTAHVGYFVGIAALIWHCVAVEIASRRIVHDLWIPETIVAPMQFSITQIFTWMTVPPLVIAYFQVMSWLLPA